VSIWTDLSAVSFEQRFRDVKGVRTRSVEAGDGDVLVLLHGTGGHAEAYMRNMKRHSSHFRTVALDMVGHGYSDAPDIEYSMDDYVEHLKDFADTIGAEKISISGESLGGMVAAHFAIRYPERTRRIVMNTGLLMNRVENDRVGLRDLLERTRKATGELTREAVRARLAWLMHTPETSVTEELVDIRHAIYSQPGRPQVMRKIMEVIAGGLLDDEWTAKYSNPEDLRKIECPALILWSRYNPGLQVENAAQALPYLKHGSMVVMEHSSHWPQWEEAELFDKVHIDFLEGRG
jgi:2-hydroxy-6-oxonona-2,4-dienedioate hydrolase